MEAREGERRRGEEERRGKNGWLANAKVIHKATQTIDPTGIKQGERRTQRCHSVVGAESRVCKATVHN